jgi:hypothetical protein
MTSGKTSLISMKMQSTSTLRCAPIVLSTVGTPSAFAEAPRAASCWSEH